MRIKLIFLSAVLSLAACSSVQVHTNGSGHFFNQRGETITVIGSPLIRCYDHKGNIIAEGKLVRCNYDNSLTIDLFGKGYHRVYQPECDLNPPDLRD